MITSDIPLQTDIRAIEVWTFLNACIFCILTAGIKTRCILLSRKMESVQEMIKVDESHLLRQSRATEVATAACSAAGATPAEGAT